MTVMVLPDLIKKFVIYCDASLLGLGASIGHEFVGDDGKTKFRPIAYASRVLTGSKKKWPSFKLEVKCIHYALDKWEHFVYGSAIKTIVYTDMLALTAPKHLNKTNCRLLLSWSMKLSEFNFELRHVKGVSNDLADMLSRAPTSSADIWDHWVSIIRNQEKVPALINLLKESIMTKDIPDSEGTEVKSTAELGSFDNPLPVTLTQLAEVLDEQLTDGPLREVRNWLTTGKRPHSSQASGMDKTTRAYYSKFKRVVV